jgi:UDP-N-acetyl-D-glucosamine dehydrogenase
VFDTANIPRIVGGVSERSTRAAAAAYARFVEKVQVVSNARTAEMAKLLENTFRWVNIGLANEMSFVARALGVDIWEAIEAAATKPFGFMPFYPGPGVGGHCIPLDPFYLRWAAEATGEGTRFIELAAWVNQRMPQVVVGRVQEALNQVGKPVRGSQVLVVGVAYKPNVSDWRESPALACIQELRRLGAAVHYTDPLVPAIVVNGSRMDSVPLAHSTVSGSDCVLILTDHDDLDYRMLLEQASLVFDVRNALRRRGLDAPHVHRL